MNLENRLTALSQWAKFFDPGREDVIEIANRACEKNRWFTPANTFLSIDALRKHFLQRELLQKWVSNYSISNDDDPKTIGIVMAGNIPLVSFHDLLCVMVSGHKALLKLSSKDDVLLPFFLKKLFEIDEEWKHRIAIADILKGMDAVIATGSNNTTRYFEYYFSKYPHIFRKNRGSVAVLSGNETREELKNLGTDIFSYFGLGCRNVSKLMVPESYSFDLFFDALEPFRYVIDHNKYKNNYDYNRTLLLMNKEPHLANEFLMVREDRRIVSPVAMVHYEFYTDETDLEGKLAMQEEEIQCIAGAGYIPMGKTQSPELWDYADNIDTLKFLSEVK